jgi:hypothetical protein
MPVTIDRRKKPPALSREDRPMACCKTFAEQMRAGARAPIDGLERRTDRAGYETGE